MKRFHNLENLDHYSEYSVPFLQPFQFTSVGLGSGEKHTHSLFVRSTLELCRSLNLHDGSPQVFFNFN
jgi:hypothetical protein